MQKAGMQVKKAAIPDDIRVRLNVTLWFELGVAA